MLRQLLLLTGLLGCSCLFAQGNFTPLACENLNAICSLESSISGYVKCDDGSIINSGSLPLMNLYSSGISQLISDLGQGEVKIYNLEGIYVGNETEALDNGIYILRKGDKVWKIIKTK